MKRDMDLVRRILIDLSEASGSLSAEAFATDRISFDDVCYHFRIMDEAGLVWAVVVYDGDTPRCGTATGPTWAGSDFLASVRSDTIWSKVKERVAKATGDASLDVIKSLAVKLSEAALLAGL